MAQELSRLPATAGKETAHGVRALHVREVRLEGLDDLIQLPSGAGDRYVSAIGPHTADEITRLQAGKFRRKILKF